MCQWIDSRQTEKLVTLHEGLSAGDTMHTYTGTHHLLPIGSKLEACKMNVF